MVDAELIRLLQEAVDRARRIETRLTKFLEANGFETGVRKPLFDPKTVTIEVPSMLTSFADCVQALPPDWSDDDEVAITHRGRTLGYVALP